MLTKPIVRQYPARSELRPGVLLQTVSNKNPKTKRTETWVEPHSVRGGFSARLFALRNEHEGAEPYDAFNARQQVYAIAGSDMEIDAWLAAGEKVFRDSPLVSNGDGCLCHISSVPGGGKQIVAMSLEDVDLDGLPPKLIRVRTT